MEFHWHDAIRVACLTLGIVNVVVLGRRFSQESGNWNTKTLDYWYAMVLWSIVSVTLPLEGMIENRGIDPRLFFYTIATAVTTKGLLHKGSWGGRA